MVAPKPGVRDYIDQINQRAELLGLLDHVAYHPDGAGITRLRKLHNLGPIGAGVQYYVHCPDVQTTIRGLVERVYLHWETRDGVREMCPPFQPSYETVVNELREARSKLLSFTCHVDPWTVSQFLAPLGGSKLALYTTAAESLRVDPVTQRDARLKTFVKAEKLEKPEADPRVIQPRDPRFNISVGLYIKACEPVIYKAINKMFAGKTVMKGLNADQRGTCFAHAWSRFKKPVAVGLDASRWDQHVSKNMLRFEHTIYNSIFHDPELARLLEMQLINEGSVRCVDGNIRYTVEGRRMSGDMNTSLGNVLLMCMLVWTYLKRSGFVLGESSDVALLNDGDDCVLIFESDKLQCLDGLSHWFSTLGFIMKVEKPVYELEHVEFCQAHPIEVDDGVWRMVRDPRKVLSKDTYVVKPINNKMDWDFYRTAIGQCGLSLAGDLPVFFEFYQCLIRGADPSCLRSRRNRERALPDDGMQRLAHGMKVKYSNPSVRSRVSFCRAFDIWPDEQVALEQAYRNIQLKWSEPLCRPHIVDEFDLTHCGR